MMIAHDSNYGLSGEESPTDRLNNPWKARAEAAEARCARLERETQQLAKTVDKARAWDGAQKSWNKGAADMRERAAKLVENIGPFDSLNALANEIRALPIESDQ